MADQPLIQVPPVPQIRCENRRGTAHGSVAMSTPTTDSLCPVGAVWSDINAIMLAMLL